MNPFFAFFLVILLTLAHAQRGAIQSEAPRSSRAKRLVGAVIVYPHYHYPHVHYPHYHPPHFHYPPYHPPHYHPPHYHPPHYHPPHYHPPHFYPPYRPWGRKRPAGR
ncbi:hypothetical protein Tcan_04365 [Toxocara canis]|uniref:Uncharacterized protein n=1 Tax=Toxocara canis TaxID=6265 RepID=A0A0B2VF36_TOXCA|nr:hypothetical protein Tcan_04365 [Toxocara canis]